MKFRYLKRDSFSDLVAKQFNPPLFDVEYSRVDFAHEYEDVRSAVLTALSSRNLGDEDVLVSDEVPSPPSRLIQVNIQTVGAWQSEPILTLNMALKGQSPEYGIWLFHEFLDLAVADAFITNEEIFGAGDPGTLMLAGFVFHEEML